MLKQKQSEPASPAKATLTSKMGGSNAISAGKIGTLLESHKHLKQFAAVAGPQNFTMAQASSQTSQQLLQASSKAIVEKIPVEEVE